MTRSWIESVSATRDASRLTAQIGDKAAMVVTVQNTGKLPVPWLLWEDSVPSAALVQRPPRIAINGKRHGILQLSGKGQKSLLYQVTFLMRGYYQFGPLLLESGDLFGLHRRFRVVTEPHFVLVLPQVVPLDGYSLTSQRPIGEVTLTHRLFEDPTRIAGVRQYAAGDPLNRVHWRATARTGILHSKVYEASCIAGATIVLDFHVESYVLRSEPACSELAITAAASLANAVSQMGQQVGFLTNGRDAADRIRAEGWKHDFFTREAAQEKVEMHDVNDRLQPVVVDTRRGADQLMQILETLARVELSDGLTFSQLIFECGSRLPRDATVVAILADVSLETALALGSLRRRGFAVTAVLVIFDDDHYPDCFGRLLAEGVDVRRVENLAAISSFCAEQAVR
jgi:uncharacterized protein (DUF58 family)